MRISEGFSTRVKKGSGFRSRHDHRAGGQGLQGIGPDVAERLGTQPARAASRAQAQGWKDRPRAAAALRFPTPFEAESARAGHSRPWFWVLRSTRIRPIHGAVSCVCHPCRTRPFSALQTCRRTSRHQKPATAHPPPRSRRPCCKGYDIEPCRICLGHSDVSTTMIYTHVLKLAVPGGAHPASMRCRPSLSRGAQVQSPGFLPARRPSVPHRTAGCGKSSCVRRMAEQQPVVA